MRTFRGVVRAVGGLVVAAGMLLAPVTAALAEDQPDDGLAQTIDPNQAQGSGQVVLDDGHIDYGPTLNTGEWIIQIHDDTAQPSYWRMPSDVVALVNDTTKLAAPDDPAYAFLGLQPGQEVWVIPQVRRPGAIWAGWNTQEPTVLDSLSLGTTQRILGVDGPGEVSVYLQAGNFGEPQSLWSTLDAFPQESWIEVNTHTHANWVFSEPGVYLVELEFEGQLNDGSTVTARDTLRFAVGDETDAQAAFEAEFDESLLSGTDAAGTDEGSGASGTDAGSDGDASGSAAADQGLGLLIGIVAGMVGAGLLVAIVIVALASNRAKQRARAARAGRADPNVGHRSEERRSAE